MTKADDLVILRTFEAPRDLVYQNWTRSEDVKTWFAPEGFTVTKCEFEARPGARWRVEYGSPDGMKIVESGEFREVTAPDRLIFTLVQDDGQKTWPETLCTVTFTARGAATEMRFVQSGIGDAKKRDDNAEGWAECFGLLERHLAR